MRERMKRAAAALAWGAVLIGTLTTSLAADERTTAACFLQERQVLAGDENGDLMLDKYLTRAELATILTRIVGNPEHVEADRKFYASQCRFTDVPDWARHYVGYCASNHLLLGYGNGLYGARDPVTPAAACTVMLRYLEEYEGVVWTYDTACQRAMELGIAPAEALAGDRMDRGSMAILIYRSMLRHLDPDAVEVPTEPQTAERYIPQVGDVLLCDDGYEYHIVNVDRWDGNAFSDGPLPELPQPTCDWSRLPQVELPGPELRHFSNEQGDYLFMRNLYESQRMLYTLYNAIGEDPETWRDGGPVLNANGEPKVQIRLTIPNDVEAEFFWPWRASQIEEPFHALPYGTHSMEAWDVYRDGVFLRTEYNVYHEN